MNERKRSDDFGGDGYQNRGAKDQKYDDPPNSRLFIVCGKNITEKDFLEAFQKFGTIEEIWVVKDKTTGESKGVAYIKFSKTSEAAAALETMNGSCIAAHPRPLKVLIAHSREQGSKREMNEEERLLRLFVVIPKSMTDAELRQHFSQFGDLDYVSIVKDHATKESKGFAYVRYHRVSHAAKAFEGCDKSFRPVFADPKPPKADRSSVPNMYSGNSLASMHSLDHSSMSYADNSAPTEGYTRLNIIASPTLNQDQLWRLFDLVPEMDYCQILHDPLTRQFKGHAFVVYKNPHAAAYAKEKLHGFEYPIGQRLIVKPDFDGSVVRSNGTSLINRGSQNNSNRSLQTGLANLAETLAHATSIIQQAGLSPGIAPSVPPEDAPICSVPLPPRQPWAASDAEAIERLFIVCQPEPPPPFALRDVFCRFGNLIDVFMLGGRNCGYAKFANKQSANAAIAALHGQTVCGSRLKVMTAEPARDPGRKRARVGSDQ